MISPLASRSLLLASCLLGLSASAVGQGDTCSSATPVAGLGTFTFNSTGNGNSFFNGGAACGGLSLGLYRDVFWQWTAPAAGDYQFDTFGTGFNTMISIHSGSACSATCLDFNDNSASSLQSRVFALGVNAGDRILVQIGGRPGGVIHYGPGQLNIRALVDPCAGMPDDRFEDNDTLAQAVPLAAGAYAGLKASTIDEDFYAVTLQPGENISTRVLLPVVGDVDLELLNGSGARIDGGEVSLNYQNSGANPEVVYIRVFVDTAMANVSCATYGLGVKLSTYLCGWSARTASKRTTTACRPHPSATGRGPGCEYPRMMRTTTG